MKLHIKPCICSTCKTNTLDKCEKVECKCVCHSPIIDSSYKNEICPKCGEEGKKIHYPQQAQTEKVECAKCREQHHHFNGKSATFGCECECHKVKPEGVGGWEKTNRIEMIRLKCDLLYSAGVQGDGKYLVRVKDEIEESISTLLLQEKAKWKEKIVKLRPTAQLVQTDSESLLDEVLALIDKL